MRLVAIILKVFVVAGLLMSSPTHAGPAKGPMAKAAALAAVHAVASLMAADEAAPCLDGNCREAASKPKCPAGLGSCGPVFLVAHAAPLTFTPGPAELPLSDVPQLTVTLVCNDPPPPRASISSV